MNKYTKFCALLLMLFISSGLNANTFFRTYDLDWDIESCIGTIELSENGNIVLLRNDNGWGPILEGIMFLNASGDSISFSYGPIGPCICVSDELDIVHSYYTPPDNVHFKWTDLYCTLLKSVTITGIDSYSWTAECIIHTLDGGFLTCGDSYVLKVDSAGVYEWDINDVYGPWYSYIAQGVDGTYLAGGQDQYNDEYCCNISCEGIVQWEWTSSEMAIGWGHAAVGTPDSGYAVSRNQSDILKLSASGDSLWCYTSTYPEIIYNDLVVCGTDILACGLSWADSFSVVTRLDSQGNLIWERIYHNCCIGTVENAFDSGFILSGCYPYPLYATDTASLIIKTDSEGWWGGTGIEPEQYISDLDITVYPNPSSSFSVVSFTLGYSSLVNLSVFDAAGRLVMEYPETQHDAGENEITVEGFGSGVYFCSINSGNFTATQRFVVIE